MEKPPQPTPQQTPAGDSQAVAESRQLSALMEILVRENRAQMADFAEAMRLRDQLSLRIGSRTTQIIRFSAAALVVMGSAMVVLILTLTNQMGYMSRDVNTMSSPMRLMPFRP